MTEEMKAFALQYYHKQRQAQVAWVKYQETLWTESRLSIEDLDDHHRHCTPFNFIRQG